MPKTWRGLIHPPNLQYAVVVELEDKWVNDNISKGFQKILKELWDKDNPGYIVIPEGDTSRRRDRNDTGAMDGPKMHGFINKYSEKRGCVLGCAAAGLHYLGLQRLSFFFNVSTHDKDRMENGMEFF